MPEAASRSTSPTLNVLDLLPVGFVKRFDVPTDLSVTPLPADLERNIDSHMESDRSPWTKDLQALFSYEHLGYLYARFLGPRGTPVESAVDHPLWTHLADVLVDRKAAPSRDLLRSEQLPTVHSLDSLSGTLCELRTEMATNMSNLWEGSLYDTSLDYLLRFLLRFHLAPKREAKYYQRLRDEASKKADQTMIAKAQQRLTHKSWIDNVARTENDLGRELRREIPKTKHIHYLLSNLERLASKEPNVEHHQLAFKDRMDKANQASEKSGLVEEIVMRSLCAKVDEIDEEAEEEEEDEEEEQCTPTSGKQPGYSNEGDERNLLIQ